MIHIVTIEKEPLVCIHPVRNIVYLSDDGIVARRPDVFGTIIGVLNNLNIPHSITIDNIISLESTEYNIEIVEDNIYIIKGTDTCKALTTKEYYEENWNS